MKRDAQVTAVLGPTNTGKTFLAMERMLGHASGMIGFPLRLLARENYDRILKRKRPGEVALITGEEKILPPGARYFVCTVESMPVARPVSFLAVDEIQLAADRERGHVFTDRLLHARGSAETMFLGAETVRPLIGRLVPEAEIITRPRFSRLAYAGPRKLTRLPPRSAVVAFSAAEVYAMAELIRRQRGGTAVVLGALSPRTRNAQVELFESGEVDYLVATDAIGMGLNLALDHVAFARLGKFDGRDRRRLTPAEIAQIAGRAGRHMNDGTFGTTAELGSLSQDLIEAVEEHRFEPLAQLYWRNSTLDLYSPQALLRSLEARPPSGELLRGPPPDDQQALATLARDPEFAALAGDREAVRLLWEVCQIPDFRKTLSDQHTRLLGQIFRHLRTGEGRLPADWVAAHIARIDRRDGDIDALVARIAHVRTWTFVSHRADWLEDAVHWQGVTRTLEDRLSDALHERLTQRFLDRRAAALVKRLKTGQKLLAAVRSDGEVLVEGEHVGRLVGFRFQLDSTIEKQDSRAVLAATRRALAGEMPGRLSRLERDEDGAFRLLPDGRLLWREAAVARLSPGEGPLKPQVVPLGSEFLDGRARERLRRRLDRWLRRHLKNRLKPLFALEEAPLQGPLRGLAFQLAEALGVLPRQRIAAQLATLGKGERQALAALKVRSGAESLFLPALLKPGSVALRALLWATWSGRPLPELGPALPGHFRAPRELDEASCHALGYRRFATAGGEGLALRVDRLERLAALLRRRAASGSFLLDEALAEAADCPPALLPDLLTALGYQREGEEVGGPFRQRARGRRRKKEGARGGPKPMGRKDRRTEDSPFAALRHLRVGVS